MAGSMKTIAISSIVLSALLGMLMYPYRYTLLHLITRDVYGKTACKRPATVPKLTLRTVKECEDTQSDPRYLKEPCIVRGAVSKKQLEDFISLNGDEKWIVKTLSNSSEIGHPLMESPSIFSHGRVSCSLNDLMNNITECIDTYTGFKELNFSNHLPLQNEHFDLEYFQRTDTFLGNMKETKVTASFHSNNFEASGSLQIVGHKLWLLMSPSDFFNTIDAYSIGAYNAAYSTCVEDLEGIDFQTIWTQPGDYMRFPKAWTHQIYTLPGPNLMINFRNFVFYPWKLRDIISLLAAANANHFVNHCDEETTAPTNYGTGHPTPHSMHKLMLGYDMRCTDLLNEEIKKYKGLVRDLASDHGADAGILQQLVDFLHVPSEIMNA